MSDRLTVCASERSPGRIGGWPDSRGPVQFGHPLETPVPTVPRTSLVTSVSGGLKGVAAGQKGGPDHRICRGLTYPVGAAYRRSDRCRADRCHVQSALRISDSYEAEVAVFSLGGEVIDPWRAWALDAPQHQRHAERDRDVRGVTTGLRCAGPRRG